MMWRRWSVLALIAPLVLIAVACKEDKPVIVREVTDDDLRAMVLKVEDLPPGFTLKDEKLTGNEEYAKVYKDPQAVRGLFDNWGRAAGLDNLFTATDAPDKPRQPVQVSSGVERFADIQHARDAWRNQKQLDEYATMRLTGTRKVDGPRLGDQSVAQRSFVTDENGRDLVVYSVSFRKDTVIATVITFNPKYKDDKGEHAFQLARLVQERVNGRLKPPI